MEDVKYDGFHDFVGVRVRGTLPKDKGKMLAKLDKAIEEFKKHDKARFYQDNFVDSIDFDYLEIHVIEE